MKKLVQVSFLFAIVALALVLAIGTVAGAEPKPVGTATRIDFEVSGDVAKEGLYIIQEVPGGMVASWYAMDGWQDSGWMDYLHISKNSVWVQVLYYPGPDTEPTVMEILNHVPGRAYGWLAKGTAHALEVGWPDSEE